MKKQRLMHRTESVLWGHLNGNPFAGEDELRKVALRNLGLSGFFYRRYISQLTCEIFAKQIADLKRL